MVTAHQLVAFGVAAFVLIAIPGPSVLFVIGRALAHGRATALLSVLGNSLGLLLVLVLVALGLGAVVAESAVVFLGVKLVGAVFLVWLGVQAVRRRRGFEEAGSVAGSAGLPPARALRQGFVVGFSNPKAFMIFAALLPQFVDRGEGQVAAQMLLLGLLAFLIGLLSDSRGRWPPAGCAAGSSVHRGAGGPSAPPEVSPWWAWGSPCWPPAGRTERYCETATTLAAAPRITAVTGAPGTWSGSRSGAATRTTTVSPCARTL